MAVQNQSGPNRSRSSSEERGDAQRISKPAAEAKEYWVQDKVYYNNKIWEVTKTQYDGKQGRWVLELKLEDSKGKSGNYVTVKQGDIQDLAGTGPKHGTKD